MARCRTCFEGRTTGFVDGLNAECKRMTVKITPRILVKATKRMDTSFLKRGTLWEEPTGELGNHELGLGKEMFEMPIRHLCGKIE